MFEDLHSSIQQNSFFLQRMVEEMNHSWDDVFKIIKSPSFLEIAHYLQPNVKTHPINSFYVHFLDSQIEQTKYSPEFWQKLTSDGYLLVNSLEDTKYITFFHDQIIKNSNLMGDMFDFYFEHNKPIFFSNLSTSELNQTFSFFKKKFIEYFKEGYVQLSNEYHHYAEENEEQYFYTAKRFFPSFPHAHKVFSYINDKFNTEISPSLSFEKQGLLVKTLQNIFYNENYFHQIFFYFVNIFNEELSLNSLKHLSEFPIINLSEMNRLYFINQHTTENNFQKIKTLSNSIQHHYLLRNYYNLTLSPENSLNIPIYSPIDTINHFSSLDKHLSLLKDFNTFSGEANKHVIIGSHISLSYSDLLPVACFSHFFNHKAIHCDFAQFQKEDTEILVHEYQHFLDNLFLNQIIDTSTLDSQFFHISSSFPIEFQNIFTKNSNLSYKQTFSDNISNNTLLSDGYSYLFKNFLYSLTSSFSISESVIDSNNKNMNFISDINNLVSKNISSIIIHSYKNQLSTTEFSDPFFKEMANEIVHDFFTGIGKRKLSEYLEQQLERSFINLCISKYTVSSLNFMLSDFNQKFDNYEEMLVNQSIYQQELFLIPFNLSSYDEIIQKIFFTELLAIHYSISNILCELEPKYQELFSDEKINPYNKNMVLFINEAPFLYDFTTAFFKESCQQLQELFISLQPDIEKIVIRNQPIEIISISTDSNFRKTYVPIPNIFNNSIQKIFKHPNVEYGIYLNYPSEILARSVSSLFDLKKTLSSNFFSILKGKDFITNGLHNSEENYTISLKDFDKSTLSEMIENHLNFLHSLEQSLLSDNTNTNNLIFFPTKESYFITSTLKKIKI